MFVFLLLALYLIFVRLAYGEKSGVKESVLCAIGFILVLALRSPYNGCDLVGGDYTLSNSYYGAFDRMPLYGFKELLAGSFYSHFEIGFLLYTKLISIITSDFQWFIAITSVVQIVPLAYFFYKYSPNITLSFFIFGCLDFFSFYFSGIRQSIAISIGVIAIHMLIDKKLRYFLLLVLLASSFHTTALFLLFVLGFYKLKLPLAWAGVLCLVIIFTIPVLRPFLLWISETFFAGGYEGYLKEGSSALTMFVIYMFFFLSSYLYKSESNIVTLVRWFVLVGVFFQSFGALNNGALTRSGYYFLIFLPILLSFITMSVKEKFDRNLLSFVVVFLFSVFFFLTVEGPRNVVPYYFFWDKPL